MTFALFANFVPAAKAEKFCDFSDEAQARFLKDENLLKIPKNTRIFLKFNDDLSSETVNSSDIVTVQLARDWKFKDKIVAPEGSIVSGKISFVEKAGNFNKDGKLGICFYEIQRPDDSVSEIKVRPLILKKPKFFVRVRNVRAYYDINRINSCRRRSFRRNFRRFCRIALIRR